MERRARAGGAARLLSSGGSITASRRSAAKAARTSLRITTAAYTIALPLLLRPVEASGGEAWSDATSVYGYAGPLASHAGMPASVVRSFQKGLTDALVARRIVTVFSRLHPLIPQRGMLAALGECRPEGETVSIDLTRSPEEQWARYRPSIRARIGKLRRAGLVGQRDRDKRHLAEFADIYHQTMRRVKAHRSYLFETEYFTRLASGLGEALELFVVTLDGAVVAGGLFTICGEIVQYHLGGDVRRLPEARADVVAVRHGSALGKRGRARGPCTSAAGSGRGRIRCSTSRRGSPTDGTSSRPGGGWSSRTPTGACATGTIGGTPSSGAPSASCDYFPRYRCSTAPAVKKGRRRGHRRGRPCQGAHQHAHRVRRVGRGGGRRRRHQVGHGRAGHPGGSDRARARRPRDRRDRGQRAAPGDGEDVEPRMADRGPSLRLRPPVGEARARHGGLCRRGRPAGRGDRRPRHREHGRHGRPRLRRRATTRISRRACTSRARCVSGRARFSASAAW